MSVVTVLKSVNAILAPPIDKSLVATKKEKRGIFGFGAHANHNSHHHHDDHHNHHNPYPYGYAPHYDDFAPHPPHPPPPHNPGFFANLGAHFHTTITKKVGVPYPVPYPVKVSKSINLTTRTYLCYSLEAQKKTEITTAAEIETIELTS